MTEPAAMTAGERVRHLVERAGNAGQPAGGDPEYWTPAEFAGVVRISLKTVYRLASSDPTLPALRFGKSLRFPVARVRRWLARKEQGVSGRPRRLAPVPPREQRG